VALATASVRLITFILAKMAFTCDFTVPSLINSAEPISLWGSDFGSRVIEIAARHFASAKANSHGMKIAFRFDNHQVTKQGIMSATNLA